MGSGWELKLLLWNLRVEVKIDELAVALLMKQQHWQSTLNAEEEEKKLTFPTCFLAQSKKSGHWMNLNQEVEP